MMYLVGLEENFICIYALEQIVLRILLEYYDKIFVLIKEIEDVIVSLVN